MEDVSDFLNFMRSIKTLTTENRPVRLRLAHPDGISEDVLLPQRVVGSESICGGIAYRIDCVASDARLPLKQFIALPAELQFVTDRGGLCKVCGIVTEARAGQSDGGLATYQLLIQDAFAIMEQRVNTRIFRHLNEVGVIEILLTEWRLSNAILAASFNLEIDQQVYASQYPKREFIKQHNESDAGFMRRLMKRRGIAWFFRAGHATSAASLVQGDDTPAHTLVLFDNANSLRANAAGVVRFHRDSATEQRDTITSWNAARVLRPASVSRHSWNYQNPTGTQFMTTNAYGTMDQGANGNAMAASLNDYLVDTPHVGDDHEDQARLGHLRLKRHEYETKCHHGTSSVRDLRVGESIGISGHPELDTHPESERAFVITELSVVAENNLPPALERTARGLFARNRWDGAESFDEMAKRTGHHSAVRYSNRFTCVRRGVAIVPAFDPRLDVPHAQMESAIVVGPPGQEIHCDEEGRVKLRFLGTRNADHQHADGTGASDTDGDSAWVRVASNWAGPGPGSTSQSGMRNLPRIGSEALVAYLAGDPDKPVVIGQLYNHDGLPPGMMSTGGLPGSKCLTGIQSRELHGMRANQLRFDDTPGEISAQLASAHGASELNLGYLTHSRLDGKGAARGEGAELRSDKTVALRGAQGILLSADGRKDAQGSLLDRSELIGMVEVLHSVANQLATVAATHAEDGADGPHLAQLISKLKAWDSGSNAGVTTGAQNPLNDSAPILAASAPAGIVMASQENLVLGAAHKIDMLCSGDTELSTGHKLLLRAIEGVSLFALRLGVKLIAASGDIRIQAQDGNIGITALKRIRLTAAEGIDIEAPEVRLAAKGARANYEGGKITQQCTGDFALRSARFSHTGPGGASPADVSFPRSDLETDERIVAIERQSGLPIKARRYTATLENGKVLSGVTDQDGRTELLKDTDMSKVVITFHDD